MKKTFFARRNALISPGNYRLAGGVLLVALFLVALRVFAPGILALVVTPVSKLSATAAEGMQVAGGYLSNPATLGKALDNERALNRELTNQNAVLSARVQDLSQLLGSRATAADSILAGVLSRPPESPYDTLLLDQGTAAGMVIGARVFGPGGIPVGTISSVTGGTSRATLYSAPGVVTEGWLGEKRQALTLTGEGAGAFAAHIARESAGEEGETVFLPGPGAVPFGMVVRVESDPSLPLAMLRIKPLVNPFSLTWVTISKEAL